MCVGVDPGELCHFWKSGHTSEHLNELVEPEAFVDSVRVKSVRLKDVLFEVLTAFFESH